MAEFCSAFTSSAEMLSSRYRWQAQSGADVLETGAIPLVAAMDVKFLGPIECKLTIDPAL